MMKVIPVILAGGGGKRLYPISTKENPKQFNKEIAFPCLFQRACTLVSSLQLIMNAGKHGRIEMMPATVVTSHEYEHLVRPFQAYYLTLILEPASKNTAYAILSACLAACENYGDDCMILVLPSDHIIESPKLFAESVRSGMQFARENIVTFGVKPLHAETEYGYIEVGDNLTSSTFRVQQFKEKPNVAMAQKFVSNGNFYWNSGIFLINAKSYIETCNVLQPHNSIIAKESFKNAEVEHDADCCTVKLSQEYTQIEGNSIDYAILEKSPNIVMTKLLSPWSDIGSFKMLNRFFTKNANNHSNKVQRCWGSYEVLFQGSGFKVKRILVNPCNSLSLQSHEHRSEHWVVICGTANVLKGEIKETLKCGQSTDIPCGVKHRLANDSDSILEIIEVQRGEYLEEDDIVRY